MVVPNKTKRNPSLFDRAADSAINHFHAFMPPDFLELIADSFTPEGQGGPDEGPLLQIRPTELVFGPDQPNCFYAEEGGVPYRGQDAAKKRLDTYIRGMSPEGRFKTLLIGPPGLGKTALALILADRVRKHRRANSRFFKLLPSQLDEKGQRDVFIRSLHPNDIVFVDEAHELEETDFLPVLDDTGEPLYPAKDGSQVAVPPTVSWIMATTDPGELSGAMWRRLEPVVMLDPPDEETLTKILLDQPFSIEMDAAREAARRSAGHPWQAKLLHEEATRYARVEGASSIRLSHMKETFGGMGLDDLGLLPQDRRVIQALLRVKVRLVTTNEVLHKMGEIQLCEVSGLDRHTYKKKVQPKLMRLGLLTIRGGQCLTPKGVKLYGHLAD